MAVPVHLGMQSVGGGARPQPPPFEAMSTMPPPMSGHDRHGADRDERPFALALRLPGAHGDSGHRLAARRGRRRRRSHEGRGSGRRHVREAVPSRDRARARGRGAPATVGSGAGNVTDTSVMSATGIPSTRCACCSARPNAAARGRIAGSLARPCSRIAPTASGTPRAPQVGHGPRDDARDHRDDRGVVAVVAERTVAGDHRVEGGRPRL